MAFNWNRFAYTNFHELNLDWFNEHFKEIFEEWEELYNTLTQWKIDTDADLAQWKEDTLSDMDTWERELLAALDEWKADTGNDISDWESGVISDLNDWKETFLSAYESLEDRVEAIVSDTEEMVENLAELFSAEANYSKGDYVIYNGVLYEFTANHTAGAWTGSDAVQKTAMNDIGIISNTIKKYNSFNIADFCDKENTEHQGLTYEWTGDSCKITGTSTSTSFDNIFMSRTELPDGIKAGDLIEIIYSSTNVYLYIYDYTTSTPQSIYGAKTGGYVKIPDSCTGLIIRLWVANGTAVNETVTPIIVNPKLYYSNMQPNFSSNGRLLYSNANNIDIDCKTFVTWTGSATTISNVPQWAGLLDTVITNSNIARQIYFPYEPEKHPTMIRGKIGGSWGAWVAVGIRGYIESVDTASASETGKTDMSAAVQYALDTYGYCKLGPGTFYIGGTQSTRIWMPEGSTIEGSGSATELRLMSGDNRYVINAHKNSFIKNLSIIGNYTDLAEEDFSSTPGTRYGIFYRKGGTSYTEATGFVGISDVVITNFTGGGIYQYDSGQNIAQGLYVNNVNIKNCWCGVYIYSLSEFCRYSNVKITYCYYATINNGGNNGFDNCVFHSYVTSFRLNGTTTNSGHGSVSNSSFCHAGNNIGKAVHISSLTNGFVFTGCQFWYNSILITDSEGVVFNGCEFGRGTTGAGMDITITGGNTNMFNGCVFMDDTSYTPVITVTNKTKFTGCYGSTSGNEITA